MTNPQAVPAATKPPTLTQVSWLYRLKRLNGQEKLAQEFISAIHRSGLTFERADSEIKTGLAEAKARKAQAIKSSLTPEVLAKLSSQDKAQLVAMLQAK